jgi:hypothetical protein
MKYKVFGIVLCCVLIAGTSFIMQSEVTAEPQFFTQNCSSCHYDDTPTCNGCHEHGRRNLTATTDLDQYQPGQTVTVMFSGGERRGWIRAILDNEQGNEVDRVSGPTGSGDDGTQNPSLEFPVDLSAPAPTTPGFYTWNVSWFGSPYDGGNPTVYPHAEVSIPTNQFEVVAAVCNDADGDGFEDSACNPTPGNGGGDCDDTNPLVNPGMVEVCGDGLDNDCDGLYDGNDPECAVPGLTQISSILPPNESVLSSAPTFSWSADGGSNNAYAVDLSLDYTFGTYWSTYENMGQVIFDTSWTVPGTLWNRVPSASYVYWRVRGADLDDTPLTIITGGEVWWFYKP